MLLLVMALPAAAQDPLLKDGFAALKAGKNTVAVKRLTDALGTGKLTPAETAKAYYGRGLAYEAMSKPAQAIADLTSAIWLGKLTPEERKNAEAKRANAYGTAGVSQPARVARQRTAALAPTTAAPATGAVATKTSDVSTTPSPHAGAQTSGWNSSLNGGAPKATVARQQSAAPKPGASGSTGSGGLSSLWQSSGLNNLFSGGNSSGGSGGKTATPPGGASSVAQSSYSGTERVPFGVRDQSSFARPPAQQNPIKTAAVQPTVIAPRPAKLANSAHRTAAPAVRAVDPPAWNTAISGGANTTAKAQAPARPPQPEGSSGIGQSVSSVTSFFSSIFGSSGSTAPAKPQVASAKSKTALRTHSGKPVQTAGRQATTKVAAAQPARSAATPAGKFNLQVATVRSLGEARSLASDLTQKHAKLLASYQTRIDETVLGNMGRFYRVRLGPFRSEKDSLSLCTKLRRSGVDCFLVAK